MTSVEQTAARDRSTLAPRAATAPAAIGTAPVAALIAPTILVADDDADIRDLVEHCLQRAGYAVLLAESGEQALALAAEHAPALFLLDCRMPGLDGFDVCRHLKQDARYSDHPVIFLTALHQAEQITHAFDVGGVDYVRKPVVFPELLARVRTHLELAASRRALRTRGDLLESVAEEQHRRLDEVRSGQESLLTDPAAATGFNVAVRFQPAHVAGGDFYEIVRFSDDEIGLFVADVAGHDLSTPFVTGALKALTAGFVIEELTPQETMIQLNASLTRFLRAPCFVSATYARFSRSRMNVHVINAGHPSPLYQAAGGAAECLTPIGDVLGMFELVRFQTADLPVRPGDRLYLYTDGATEGFPDAAGRAGSALGGLARLRASLDERHHQPLSSAIDGTVAQLLERRRGAVADDIVLLGIEC